MEVLLGTHYSSRASAGHKELPIWHREHTRACEQAEV
jgi:hypothetical protein